MTQTIKSPAEQMESDIREQLRLVKDAIHEARKIERAGGYKIKTWNVLGTTLRLAAVIECATRRAERVLDQARMCWNETDEMAPMVRKARLARAEIATQLNLALKDAVDLNETEFDLLKFALRELEDED